MQEPLLGNDRNPSKPLLLICALLGLLFLGILTLRSVEEDSFSKQEFDSFLQTHSKSYEQQSEYALRLQIFRENMEYIRSTNKKGLPYTLSQNEFTDLSFQEFRETYLTDFQFMSPEQDEKLINSSIEPPPSIDWRERGAVNPPRNQGKCGSCWAFSATGSLEAAWFLEKGELLELSQQQLVDCTLDYGNSGCNGGDMNFAFKYAMDFGITTYKKYPYFGKTGSCKENLVDEEVSVSDIFYVQQNNTQAMIEAVAHTPVSVGVEANLNWQHYSNGILTSECGTSLNHAVVLVGYSTDALIPHWIVKNSWSRYWGEGGFIRIEITDGHGKCGINTYGSYPIV